MPQIWRLKANPPASPETDPSTFCIENDVVGFGFPVEPAEDLMPWELYYRRGLEIYGNGNKGNADWHPSVHALKNRMVVGDLCWARHASGKYYLGRVMGGWEYRNFVPNKQAGVVNTRFCDWLEAGDAFNVPNAILNAFRNGKPIQRIEGEGVEAFSSFRFNGLAQKSIYEFSQRICGLFTVLGPEECEDLVGIYLQMQGYLILPGSCKTDETRFAFLLKHQSSGKHAAVQVQHGYETIDATLYKNFDGEVFLFQANGEYSGDIPPNVKCLAAGEIQEFCLQNAEVLPANLQRWIKVWRKVLGTEKSYLD
jgi:hypothetical protein